MVMTLARMRLFSPRTTTTTCDVGRRPESGIPRTAASTTAISENRFGEQFVFIFDSETGTGKVSGGDLDWNNQKSFTLELVNEALAPHRSSPPRSW